VNSNEYENLQRKVKNEVRKFSILNSNAKLEYVRNLLLDYEDMNTKIMQAESASFKIKSAKKSSKSKKITAKKEKINKIAMSKAHAGAAASIIILMSFFPWAAALGPKTVAMWTPFVASVQFTAVMTTILTWIIGEIEHVTRAYRK